MFTTYIQLIVLVERKMVMSVFFGNRWACVGLAVCLVNTVKATDQVAEQVITLHPGVNAVYLEVAPTPNDVGTVLADLPISSVWSRAGAMEGMSALDDGLASGDADVPTTTDSGWRVWFPPDRDEHVISSLRVLRGGRVYLIEATAAATVTVTGIPHTGATHWSAGHNLVGLHVARDAEAAATFGAYLAASRAFGEGVIYEIAADGTLAQVAEPDKSRAVAGVGYWIQAEENTTYDGPIQIDHASLRCIELTSGIVAHTLEVTNLQDRDDQIYITYLPIAEGDVASGVSPLVYNATLASDDNETEWRSLDAVTIAVGATGAPEARKALRVAADHKKLPADLAGDGTLTPLLRITSASGYERTLPVRLRGEDPAGLWVGTVVVDGVESLTAPAQGDATATTFDFRIIIHQSGSGVYKLLREVVLITDEQGGPAVLVTPDCYEYLDDEMIAPRISSANFSFDSSVTLAGDFATQLAATTFLAPSDPLDPYRHTYHPEHANGLSGGLIRSITMTFDGDGGGDPGWGVTRLGGSYTEHIAGLHRETIDVSGTFEIQKVSDIGSLCGQ